MPLLKGFEFDIFISYAHVDNEPVGQQKSGWVDCFHDELEVALAQRFGRIGKINIWRDEELTGNQLFDSAIKNKIDKTVLFVALHSSGYVASDYCQHELKHFHDKAKNDDLGLNIGEFYRIFNVLVNDIAHDDWAVAMQGTSGFDFYDNEDGNWPVSEKSDEFIRKVRSLVNAIHKVIEGIKTESPDQAVDDAGLKTELAGTKIFFGAVSDPLKPTRKRIITHLNEVGYATTDDIPPPYELSQHNQKAETELAECELAVHLFNEFPGSVIDGDPNKCYPQLQAELAQTSAKRQLIWLPKNMKIADIQDSTYRNYLTDLKSSKRDSNVFEIIESNTTDFQQHMMKTIEEMEATKNLMAELDSNLGILLDTHFQDQFQAMEIGQFLLQKNIQPFINPEEDDPGANISILEQRLRQVKYFVLVFGKVALDWVIARMSIAIKTIASGDYPIEKVFVYLIPPNEEDEIQERFGKFFKVDFLKSHESLLKNIS